MGSHKVTHSLAKWISLQLLSTFFALSAFAQEANDPGVYLGFIGAQYDQISESMMSYTSAAAHGKGARKVEKRRVELLQQVKESERNVRRMKPFQKETRLRDSVVSYFNLCYHVLNEDYAKILNMEEIAEQSYDLMEAYLLAKELAESKLDSAAERAGAEYKAFAASNGIKLIEGSSKVADKMKIAGKVNAYQKELFLVYFKSYKNELYFLEAVSKGNVSAMEQSISALKASTDEALAKLTKIQTYNGDGSLRNSCQELIRFYQRETRTHFPAIVDFEIKKENLVKMQKAVEAKRPAERTQEEINALNAAIKEYNNLGNKINAMGEEGNKTRSTLINTWNSRVDGFFDKYTPRHR